MDILNSLNQALYPGQRVIRVKGYAEMYKKILDSYIDNMNKIENLKKMYWAE